MKGHICPQIDVQMIIKFSTLIAVLKVEIGRAREFAENLRMSIVLPVE